MTIQTVAVVGGGLMGRQIALHTARYGYKVFITDTSEAVRSDIAAWAEKYIAERVAKGKMSEENGESLRTNFTVSDTLAAAVKDADLVIEAIIEDEEIKKGFFKQLCTLVREDTIIATNSSRMVSSLFVDSVTNPGRLVNMHYFNPALVMKLVEVVKGDHVSDETAEAAMEFVRSTEKIPVLVRKEIDGFVANRILSAISDEAYRLVDMGICSYEEVDLACENALNHPMGPFRISDYAGNDLVYMQKKREYEITGQKPLGYDTIEKMYQNNEWGIKTGKGFYDWPKK